MKAFLKKKLVRFYLYMILSIGYAGFPLVFPGWVSLSEAEDSSTGDLDCDLKAGLSDAILVLRLMSSLPEPSKFCFSDINKDGKVGLEEEIYILQVVAGLRSLSDIDAPAPFTGIVTRHNFWRSQVGVSPLTWSSQVASAAQAWANQLIGNCDAPPKHSDNQYGENIAWSSGSMTPEEVVDMWGGEIQNFTYQSQFQSTPAGHYTQLVWANSKEVGCGISTCTNSSGTWQIWVCDYNPKGNMLGESIYPPLGGSNAAPAASSQSVKSQGYKTTGQLQATDADPNNVLIYVLTTPEKYNVTIDAKTGQFVYYYWGTGYPDTFNFKVFDGRTVSNQATVTVNAP